jgi:cytidine deaminase
VGAVVVADDGRVFTGCNVENAAYGSAICAEANAISTAAAAGIRKIDMIVVACLDAGECYPCGNCRQLMREFSVATVVVRDGTGSLREHRFNDILPHSFGPESLQQNR